MGRNFVLVAGEASGDRLGRALIAGLRRRYPDAAFAGVGGAGMRAEGMDCWHDAEELAVMGLAEVLVHLPRLLTLRRRVHGRVLASPPDCFVGIDAPDFNLALEHRFRRRGIKTVHYVSPSVWAWRARRARRIGRGADLILTLFPFEPAVYRRHGARAEFVGHPAAEALPLEPERGGARRALGVAEDATAVALLPGSRRGELERLGDRFAQAAARLAQRRPGLVFLAPCANETTRAKFARSLEAYAGALDVRLIDGLAQTAMTAADVALVASGTAALEAMLCRTPLVVAYRIAPLTHFIVKRLGLLKIERYALPNVLAGESLVPELMQDLATPAAMAEALLGLLDDSEGRPELMDRFDQLHRQLRTASGHRAAEAIAALLEAE